MPSRLPRHHRLHGEVLSLPAAPRRIERPTQIGQDDADFYEVAGFDVEESLLVEQPSTDPSAQPERKRLRFPARAVRVFSSALLRRKMATLDRARVSEAKEVQRPAADGGMAIGGIRLRQ